VESSGIFPYHLVRHVESESNTLSNDENHAFINADFCLHDQDIKDPSVTGVSLESKIDISKRGDIEKIEFPEPEEQLWSHIYSSETDAFFFVGYGATRRVEPGEHFDMGGRRKSKLLRAMRVQGLFEDSYSLIPLTYWLPNYKSVNPGRYKQVCNLIKKIMGRSHYEFKGEMAGGEYVFERGGVKVPFQAMSDGYQAFLGWVADLLYHICFGCPTGKKLVDNKGIVMVDEIDLHLHPKWQIKVISTLAGALPNIQFILTSHSPLVAGSLEWMNIIHMKESPRMASRAQHIRESIHGLDADQILLTDFFGLSTTRSESKERRLKELTMRARNGDTKAAKELLKEMSRGMEEKE